MINKKQKIAIVGIGRWGKNLLKEFDKQADVVYACSKGSPDSIKFLQNNYPKIKHVADLDDVLNDDSIEAIVVATPTPTHFEIAKKVLGAKKHLFLEKPGTSSSEDLKILCEEAEKRNLVFAVGYEFVHHPVLKKIKELIKTEDIKSLFFEWNKWGTFEAPIIPHLLSHDISIICSLGINSLKIKNCHKQKAISEADIIEVELENDKNISMRSYINRISLNKNKSVTFVGTKKGYLWSNDNLFEIDIENKTTIPITVDNTTSVAREVEDFLESVEKNKKPLTNGEFALRVLNIIDKTSD